MAGPYDDAGTCATVEAALISSHRTTLCNTAAGNGPGFVPLGVPAELSDRLAQPVSSLSELGIKTGGCLLVRLSSGGRFKEVEDRKKYDPAHPDDLVVAENIIRYWHLGPLVREWVKLQGPAAGQWPKVIAGLGGPPDCRYIVGALDIDPNAKWVAHTGGSFEVPVLGPSVDSHHMRGCQVDGALYNGTKYGLYIWVDDTGEVRYLPKR